MNISKAIFRIVLFLISFICNIKSFSQPNANTWTWVKGSTDINQAGTYGTIGVPNQNNNPGGRASHGSWGSLSGKMYILGGIVLDGANNALFNDLWEYDISTNNWAWFKGSQNSNQSGIYGAQDIANLANSPGGRGQYANWFHNNVLYLMGGNGIDVNGNFGAMNDMWKFDLATKNWTWLRGSKTANSSAVYGNIGVESALNEPGGRNGSCTWKTNLLYLFGGYGKTGGSNGLLNDLWKYDLVTNNYTWIKGSNTENQIGIYGAKGIASASNMPGAREGAISWEYNGKLYLFGGIGFGEDSNYGQLSDLWKYDPVTNNWTWLKGPNVVNSPGVMGTKGIETIDNNPSGHQSASSWVFNDKLFLFSGTSTGGASTDDLWQYDPQTNNWTLLKGSSQNNKFPIYGQVGTPSQANTPGFRKGSSSAYVNNSKLYLMGGFGGSGSLDGAGYKNDVWEYTPCTQMATVASGNWNDPNIWSCGKVPNQNDAVFIGHNIILNSNVACKNITYTAGGGFTFSTGGNIALATP